MKNLFFLSMIFFVGALASCTDRDDNNSVDGSVTIAAGSTYELDGALVIPAGSILTIGAGATIVATPVSDEKPNVRYIAIEKGAKIIVNGTAENPVVMTSETKESSSWGGLVICGDAPQNKAGAEGGSSISEVAGLSYGGSNSADNSGTIRYLRVEYTGYKYSDTKEFNGVSFFGVGSGTTVEYVSSYKGGDDGLEFFGGTVNPKYLVSIDSEDDGIDFADGFSGAGSYWYVENALKSSIEASNNGDNGASAVPMTNARLKNISLIGSGEKPYYLKEGAGKQSVDNLVIGGATANKGAYLFYDDGDNDAEARISADDVKFTNVRFVDMTVAKAKGNISVTENADANGAGNGVDLPSWTGTWAVPQTASK
ncbi:MAG: hypothetical protein ACK5MG_02400 [Bacteroidales bacterium]